MTQSCYYGLEHGGSLSSCLSRRACVSKSPAGFHELTSARSRNQSYLSAEGSSPSSSEGSSGTRQEGREHWAGAPHVLTRALGRVGPHGAAGGSAGGSGSTFESCAHPGAAPPTAPRPLPQHHHFCLPRNPAPRETEAAKPHRVYPSSCFPRRRRGTGRTLTGPSRQP